MTSTRSGTTSPRVSDHYLDEAGERYIEQRLASPAASKYWIALTYFRRYLTETEHVLDFGCGIGGLLDLVRHHVRQADGLEVNPAAAAKAREVTGCKVFESIDELPKDRLYDVIISNHVLEHVRDVCTTLEMLRPHLRIGGRLVTMLPINDHRDRYFRRWDRNDKDHHLQTWPPRLFANVLYESGYDVEECRVINSRWHNKLEPFAKVGLWRVAAWMFATLKRRRQLLAVGFRPTEQ